MGELWLKATQRRLSWVEKAYHQTQQVVPEPHTGTWPLPRRNTWPQMAAGSGSETEGGLGQCRFWLRQDGVENSDGHYHSGKAIIDLMAKHQGRQGRLSETKGCPEKAMKFSGLSFPNSSCPVQAIISTKGTSKSYIMDSLLIPVWVL